MGGFLPKLISGLLIATLVANSVLFAAVVAPHPAQAQLVVTDPVQNAITLAEKAQDQTQFYWEKAYDLKTFAFETQQTQKNLWEQFKSNNGVIAEIVSSLALVALHVALSKFTNDIIAWINGGGKGKIRILQDPGKFLTDAVDAAGGVLAGAILNVDPRTLCNADFLRLKLKVAFTGPYAVPTFDEKVACTFSGMAEGLRKFQQDFNQGGWAAFVKYAEKPNNRIGQTLITAEEMQKIKSEKSAESVAELNIGKGYLSQKKCFVTKSPTSGFAQQGGGETREGCEGLIVSLGISRTSPDFNGAVQECIGGRVQGGEWSGVRSDQLGSSSGFSQGFTAASFGVEGKELGEAMRAAGMESLGEDAFMQVIIANGGAVQCKTVTPADQISNLATYALQKPLKTIEDAITGMTEKLGTGALSILKPYVLAIGNAALNQLLLKEKGLVSAAFQRPQKPRRANRQFSGSLQENALLGQSATALSSSVNDFRSFLLKALVDFNVFITTVANINNSSNDALGRIPIDEPDRIANGVSNPLGFPLGDPLRPYSVVYNSDGSLQWEQPATSNIYMNYPGKIFDEEARWCGAYSQEIPIGSPVTEPLAVSLIFPSQSARSANTDFTRSSTTICQDGEYMAGLNRDTDNDWEKFKVYCAPAPTGLGGLFQSSTAVLFGSNTNNGTTICPNGQYMAGMHWEGGDNTVTGVYCAPAPVALASLFQNTPGETVPADATMARNGLTLCPDGQYMAGLGRALDDNWDATQIHCAGPSSASGSTTKELLFEKYFSPTYEDGTVSVINHRETHVINGLTFTTELSANNALLARGNFYPELIEKAQELMEKVRVIDGYHYGYPASIKNRKDYLSPLADQLGANPDDDPIDNDPKNPNYANYKGSVTDMLTRYNELNQLYQALFAGLQDENSLEGVDKDLKILTAEESNIRLALIGKRCPALPPSATSTPDLIEQCPRYGLNSEYNMARKFVFEQDTVGGITTGFATNPFTGEKSSSLAGFLNLEEMTTQLGSLPPNKNIVKLVRIRQLLEQLQVAPRPIPIPRKTGVFLNPSSLANTVDQVRVSIPGYEHIQTWLNDSTTRNKDIQELITAYGYTTAEEAYPQISQELDDILDEIANQIIDKLKDVFLKRTELALEEARVNAQERLAKFIEYIRDLNSVVKLEVAPMQAIAIDTNPALAPYVPFTMPIASDASVLMIDGKDMFTSQGQTRINALLPILTDDQKGGIIGSAVYKIKTLAKFIGIDTTTLEFSSRIDQYVINVPGVTTVDDRLKNALRDVYLYYAGVFSQTDATDPSLVIVPAPANPSSYGCGLSADRHYCNLTSVKPGSLTGEKVSLYKDAKTKLEELNNDFNLMVEETSSIKEEFQNLISDTSGQKQEMEDMLTLLQQMISDYDQANACFRFKTDSASLWKAPAPLRATYGALGATTLGVVTALVGGGATFATLLAGGTLGAVAVSLSAFGVVGFAVNVFLGRKAKGKRAAAERARQAALAECARGIDNYNRHLGQLADNFVCGKINKKYEDR